MLLTVANSPLRAYWSWSRTLTLTLCTAICSDTLRASAKVSINIMLSAKVNIMLSISIITDHKPFIAIFKKDEATL